MAQRTQLRPVVFENARIMFRNFAGKEKQYNVKGNRNFALFLDPETADAMARDGWNVKHLKPRDPEDGEGQAFITVKVKFGNRPPKVVLVSSRGKVTLGEEQAEICDWVEIANVDLVINPSFWDVQGKQGIAAYLKSIFITVVEDELDLKYADVQEIGTADAPLEIEAGPGRISYSDDEIIIEDEDTDGNPPWAR